MIDLKKNCSFNLPTNKVFEHFLLKLVSLFPIFRELAFQIKDQFVALGAHINTRVSVVVGGKFLISQLFFYSELLPSWV